MITLGPVIGSINGDNITILYELSVPETTHIQIICPNGHILNTHRKSLGCIPTTVTLGPIVRKGGHHRVIIRTKVDIKYGSFTPGSKIHLISCDNRGRGSLSLWNHMKEHLPNLCIHLGDNIYMDNGNGYFQDALKEPTYQGKVETLRNAYRIEWGREPIAHILSSCMHLFHWDDHDICDSWDHKMRLPDGWISTLASQGWEGVASTLQSNEYCTYIAGIQVYSEYQLSLNGLKMPYPQSYTYTIGTRRVAILDTRMYQVGNTPLIPIEDTVDIVITGVPPFYLHPWICNKYTHWLLSKVGIRDLYDQWILHKDRLDMLLTICKHGTIIMAGDIHMSGHSMITVSGRRIHQVTSSGISTPLVPKVVTWLTGSHRMYMGETDVIVEHSPWIRENNYCILNLEDILVQPEYVLLSMI